MRSSCRTLSGLLLTALVGQTGCALLARATSTPEKPEPVKLRICLAETEPRPDYQPTKDEVGRQLYVSPQALATEADVQAASVLRGPQRGLVLVEFGPLAANELEVVSSLPAGRRLAIYIDDRLVLSPLLTRPICDGKVILDGGFSQREAERIARGLNIRRPTPIGR